MSIVRRMGRSHGISKVKIIHLPATPDETSTEVEALIQSGLGVFEVDTPIYEGDIVEVPDPRTGPGGTERRLVKQVNVNNYGSRDLHHIEVKWGAAPVPHVAPVRRLTV